MAAALGIAGVPAAAVAQSPGGPDAAPGGSSSGPSPDPAPSAAVKPARRATPQHHKKKPADHKRKDPPATKQTAVLHVPSLPRLSPAHLVAVADTTGDDSARARNLAAGALSLLLLALASAMLLAVTARVERRKVVR
jgi:hypothetical protein